MEKFILVLTGVVVAAILIAKLDIVGRLQKGWEDAVGEIKAELGKQDGEKLASEARDNLKSLFWNVLWYSGLGVVLLKGMWEWRLAPDGSFRKTAWVILVAAAIAYALYVAVVGLDNWINRSEKKLPDYRNISEDSKS